MTVLDTEVSEGVRVIYGPERLAEGCAGVLYGSDVDALYIQGLVADPLVLAEIRAVFEAQSLSNDRRADKLYEVAPQFEDVDDLVHSYWDTFGYTDYELDDRHIHYSGINDQERGIHTDRLADRPGSSLIGPLSLSLCLAEDGEFCAEQPGWDFRGAQGVFDEASWLSETELSRLPKELRSSIWHKAGDGMLFMNHPRPALHAAYTIEAGQPRAAALFDYIVTAKQ